MINLRTVLAKYQETSMNDDPELLNAFREAVFLLEMSHGRLDLYSDEVDMVDILEGYGIGITTRSLSPAADKL